MTKGQKPNQHFVIDRALAIDQILQTTKVATRNKLSTQGEGDKDPHQKPKKVTTRKTCTVLKTKGFSKQDPKYLAFSSCPREHAQTMKQRPANEEPRQPSERAVNAVRNKKRQDESAHL